VDRPGETDESAGVSVFFSAWPRINGEYQSLVSPYAAEAEGILVGAIVSTAQEIAGL